MKKLLAMPEIYSVLLFTTLTLWLVMNDSLLATFTGIWLGVRISDLFHQMREDLKDNA